MISTFHRASAPARAADRFVVRYSGEYPGFYIARILPLIVLFTLLAGLYLDDESRHLIFSRQSLGQKSFSWLEFGFLLALVTASLVDLVLTLKRVRRGAMALSVSPEGITGPVRHMTRLLTWSEIADVAVDGKFLVIRRQPRSLLQKLFAGRGLGDINIPAHHLDREVDDIRAAARRFAPAALSSRRRVFDGLREPMEQLPGVFLISGLAFIMPVAVAHFGVRAELARHRKRLSHLVRISFPRLRHLHGRR